MMIKINDSKLMQRIFASLICMIIFAFGSSNFVSAMSQGYFEGNDHPHNPDGSHVAASNVLPADYLDGPFDVAIDPAVNTVEELFVFLKNYNTFSMDNQKKTGSAFIVCSMLSNKKTFTDQECIDNYYVDDQRIVTPLGWAELKARLDNVALNGVIRWNLDYGSFDNSEYEDSSNDNYWWTQTAEITKEAIVFEYGGDVVFRIFRECANPLGLLGGLPPVDKWEIETPRPTVDSSPRVPGSTITWTHEVENVGDATNVKINYKALGNGSPSVEYNQYFNKDQTRTFTSTYRIAVADLGTEICRQTSAKPHAWDDPAEIVSDPMCVNVPYDYNLVPTVAINPSGVMEPGTTINVSQLGVTNNGSTQSKPSFWLLERIVTNPAGVEVDRKSVSNKSNVTFVVGNNDLLPLDPSYTDTDTDLIVGSKICYQLSVIPGGAADSGWARSTLDNNSCVVVAKKPKVQVWGGDLLVGGLVKTSTSDKSGSRFGSWVEYGIIAGKEITGAASASAFAGVTGLAFDITSGNACNYSNLSFTNAGSTTCAGNLSSGGTIGNYASTRTIPDVAASFQINASTPSPSPNLDSLQGIYTTTGPFTINGGNIKKGQWVVINAPNADIVIAGSIIYTTDVLKSIGDIPQVVIIANKIIINDNVSQVDAWLVATKNDGSSIYTCDKEGKVSTECNTQLIVNGPVMTNHLYLRRTFGSGTVADSGTPAEIINLRADAYLWAANRATSNGKIQSVYTTELPPKL